MVEYLLPNVMVLEFDSRSGKCLRNGRYQSSGTVGRGKIGRERMGGMGTKAGREPYKLQVLKNRNVIYFSHILL